MKMILLWVVALLEKKIPNYPPYENVDNSVCMKKTL